MEPEVWRPFLSPVDQPRDVGRKAVDEADSIELPATSWTVRSEADWGLFSIEKDAAVQFAMSLFSTDNSEWFKVDSSCTQPGTMGTTVFETCRVANNGFPLVGRMSTMISSASVNTIIATAANPMKMCAHNIFCVHARQLAYSEELDYTLCHYAQACADGKVRDCVMVGAKFMCGGPKHFGYVWSSLDRSMAPPPDTPGKLEPMSKTVFAVFAFPGSQGTTNVQVYFGSSELNLALKPGNLLGTLRPFFLYRSFISPFRVPKLSLLQREYFAEHQRALRYMLRSSADMSAWEKSSEAGFIEVMVPKGGATKKFHLRGTIDVAAPLTQVVAVFSDHFSEFVGRIEVTTEPTPMVGMNTATVHIPKSSVGNEEDTTTKLVTINDQVTDDKSMLMFMSCKGERQPFIELEPSAICFQVISASTTQVSCYVTMKLGDSADGGVVDKCTRILFEAMECLRGRCVALNEGAFRRSVMEQHGAAGSQGATSDMMNMLKAQQQSLNMFISLIQKRQQQIGEMRQAAAVLMAKRNSASTPDESAEKNNVGQSSVCGNISEGLSSKKRKRPDSVESSGKSWREPEE